jgi:hypothetical protein
MRHHSIASSLLLVACAAQAADLTGRFVSEESSSLTLQLEQRADGSVSGYFASPSGPVAVSARPSGKELHGTMRGEDGTFEIRLRPEGSRVLVRFMTEPDGKLHPFRRAEQRSDDGVTAITTAAGTVIIEKGPREAATPLPSSAARAERVVIVNGKRLSAAELERLERKYHTEIQPADYWYDRRTGAWGVTGGPTRGFILPDLELGGGRLATDASGGGTQVFINGRELHPQDVFILQSCLPLPVQRGRYWVGANGIGGYEGGPPMFNLVALCSQKQGGAGPGGWQCSGGSCGTDQTRTGVTNIVTEPGGGAGFSVNGKWQMTP